ncbi:Ribonuclease H-like domain containing protein [Quillaja saponaria]|uniref:Ribonuclease H-like domain containing protein n=1 Tax=Quillaja saponaria TaxID=32244 RepID=A0AAD7LJZ5_QUISA|nr:Ribonuclease H-like domain containing protein [Quillaja saponaria]
MFASEEYNGVCHYASKVDAQKVEAILLHDSNFWKTIKYGLICVEPLVIVLQLVEAFFPFLFLNRPTALFFTLLSAEWLSFSL